MGFKTPADPGKIISYPLVLYFLFKLSLAHLSVSITMRETPESSCSFQNIRRLSASQIQKLSKPQLTQALKEAIQIVKDFDTTRDTITAATLKTMLSEAVAEIRQELFAEQEKRFSCFEEKVDNKIRKLSQELSLTQEMVETNVMSELEERK